MYTNITKIYEEICKIYADCMVHLAKYIKMYQNISKLYEEVCKIYADCMVHLAKWAKETSAKYMQNISKIYQNISKRFEEICKLYGAVGKVGKGDECKGR